jgi:hypothetical protein
MLVSPIPGEGRNGEIPRLLVMRSSVGSGEMEFIQMAFFVGCFIEPIRWKNG